jgi:hypothetical protein
VEVDWDRLDREYEIPRVITRTDGRDNAWMIIRRAHMPPGGQGDPPSLEIEIAVPQLGQPAKAKDAAEEDVCLDTPTLTIADRSVRFPTRLTEGQRLVCRDQTTWHVFNADGTEAASGRLSDPLPRLSTGRNPIKLDFQQQVAARFRVVVKVVKVYHQRGLAMRSEQGEQS